jgi:hypothetical protein
VAGGGDVTFAPRRGIIVVEQERALGFSGGSDAHRAKQPLGEVLAASLTGLLTIGWSDRER